MLDLLVSELADIVGDLGVPPMDPNVHSCSSP
jgi:hypothetical protein